MESFAEANISSFNYAIGEGLKNVVQSIRATYGNGIELSIHDAVIEAATVCQKAGARYFEFPLYPSECRVRKQTYCGRLRVQLKWESEESVEFTERTFSVPVMLKSAACLLQGLPDSELISLKEELDPGGYFIINGRERMFQNYLVPRQNYPVAIIRPYWKKVIAEERFTEFGVKIRSVAKDGTESDITLRLLEDNTVKVMFYCGGKYYFVCFMLLLKAIIDDTDRFFFKALVKGDNSLLKSSVSEMLANLQKNNIYTHTQAKEYFGHTFASILDEKTSPSNAADILISLGWITSEFFDKKSKRHGPGSVCTKFGCSSLNEMFFPPESYMLKKLFSLVRNEQCSENPDDLRNQEVFLGSQLYLMLLKLELKSYLKSVRQIFDKMRKSHSYSPESRKHCTNKAFYIGSFLNRALSTGNIPSSKLGLRHDTGFSVFCVRKNALHFLSYFHNVQKQVCNPYVSSLHTIHPEYWGFVCPVHTPSGMQTGLTNYLTANAKIVSTYVSADDMINVFYALGMWPLSGPVAPTELDCYVVLDGKICGFVPSGTAVAFVLGLKSYRDLRLKGLCVEKLTKGDGISQALVPSAEKLSLFKNVVKALQYAEIVLLPRSEQGHDNTSFYPGIFIFTTPGRLVRPVWSAAAADDERYIGVFEQALTHISLAGTSPPKARYSEHSNSCIFSSVASLIPFFEFNQSPRNIYSTHMIKQSIGVSYFAPTWHSDATIFQLSYPQSPLVLTTQQSFQQLEENYPFGTNAVIAVLSYSGYDMEDAVVFNKSSLERGLKHCSIIKSIHVDLIEKAKNLQLTRAYSLKFQRVASCYERFLDCDGLPHIGQILKYGDPYCSYVETESEKPHVEMWSSSESAYVHDVKILGNHGSPKYMTAVLIQFRITRPVRVGDKFANRHGQKGVCSQILSSEDMPFTADGITPDILFNPHGFPSRMTVGMMLEIITGKAASSNCQKQYIAPFQFTETDSAVSYCKKMLKEAGFNYHGTEKMYGGVSGEELECDVFCGIVYYQRLCHMVQDKYQARSTGRISSKLQQPLKSSSGHGAIRFGEMERDSLIAHGSSFILHDRFMKCSDKRTAYLCTNCSELLYPILRTSLISEDEKSLPSYQELMTCKLCGYEDIVRIRVPYAFVVLHAELSSVNIRIKLDIKEQRV